MIQFKSTSKTKRRTHRKQFIQSTVRLVSISAVSLGVLGFFYTPAFIGAFVLSAVLAIHFLLKIMGYVSSVCCGDSKYSISLEEIVADLERANG